MTQVRTRMAPSPTGNLHLGTAYATLWPYLFAKAQKGSFILRFEDTDQERSKKEFEENIFDGLKWLGFSWDEGPFHQMDRLAVYQQYAQKLLQEDHAYYCFCSKEELEKERQAQIAQKRPQVYSGKCRLLTKEEVEQKIKQDIPHVVRFKLAENRGAVEFDDLIMGKIKIESKLLGDMVILRQNSVPLYNFAVVVDDCEMKISHVLRGSDHISNTPKQILLFEALKITPPIFAHYPMVLNTDRMGKLSKRTGSTSVAEYQKEGYLPEAIINYLALLGMTPPGDREVWTLSELVQIFDISLMNKSAAAWNPQKLDWINGEYIRAMSDEELLSRLDEFLVDHPNKEKLAPLIPLVKERLKKLSDFIPLTSFLFNKPEYEKAVFDKLKLDNILGLLDEILVKMENLPSPWRAQDFESTFRQLAEDKGLNAGGVFQLIRVAVSGGPVTPPLFECLVILGEEEVLGRLRELIKLYPRLHNF